MLSKKQFYLLSSLSFFVFANLNDFLFIRNYIVTIFVVLIVSVIFGVLFYLSNKDKYVLDKIIYIAFILFSSILLPYYFENIGLASRLVYYFLISTGLYFLLLSFNVYLVAEKVNESLPLIQPARLVVFLSLIISVFIFSTVNYKFHYFQNIPVINFSVKSLFFVIYFYFLFSTIRWLFIDEKVGEFSEKEFQKIRSVSLLSTVCMSQIAVSLMFFPFESFAMGMIMAVSSYIFINIIQGLIRHRITFTYILGSIFLVVLTVFFAYLIS